MTFQEAKQKLRAVSQEHLLSYYDELSNEEKDSLLKQIQDLDLSLLGLLKNGASEAVRGNLKPLGGALTLQDINEKKQQFEEIGVKAIKQGKVGAVLLAGGQGTRLGFDKPKGMLDVGIDRKLFLFEQLINNIMDVVNQTGKSIPLFIMTSEKNDTDTRNFFEENNYFGYNRENIFFFVQEMAPSVNYEGNIYLEKKGKLATSPNGNGGWFSSMGKAGYIHMMKERGIEWLNVFAVDNILQRIADPVFIGATLEANCVCGAKAVAKAEPNEKVGVLCLEDEKPSIVEYYEMTDEMIHSREADGTLSYRYGVILNYLFNFNTLQKIMNEKIPVHVVKKKIPYIDEKQNYVKPIEPNGYKFEQLVLDMIHMMDNCLTFEVDREKEFAPIKNKTGVDSLESARELMKKNGIKL